MAKTAKKTKNPEYVEASKAISILKSQCALNKASVRLKVKKNKELELAANAARIKAEKIEDQWNRAASDLIEALSVAAESENQLKTKQ